MKIKAPGSVPVLVPSGSILPRRSLRILLSTPSWFSRFVGFLCLESSDDIVDRSDLELISPQSSRAPDHAPPVFKTTSLRRSNMSKENRAIDGERPNLYKHHHLGV